MGEGGTREESMGQVPARSTRLSAVTGGWPQSGTPAAGPGHDRCAGTDPDRRLPAAVLRVLKLMRSSSRTMLRALVWLQR